MNRVMHYGIMGIMHGSIKREELTRLSLRALACAVETPRTIASPT
jgi:hypothetical protein